MKKITLSALFLILATAFILPVIATIATSFYGERNFTLQNYTDLLFDAFAFYPAFWNSLLYAGVIVIVQLFVVIPCAFGFANASFKGKGILFIFYIILMMMPLQVTILPNFIGLRDLGLIDTRLAVILPAIFSPFGVVVINQYMQGMNNSIIEAARLETNSIIKIIFHTVIPQVKICIFAVAVFIFAESWNMLEQPMLFLRSTNLQNLSVFISESGSYAGNILFPASVFFFIPVLILYSFFNNYLEKGLTFGELAK
ncbi:MAG: carbohydrate ABC transporter permease [Oscillospiraceae bacterium]|jgi:multiple sugar transport system permease protein|nr:carbohydrate ABC transporter permease [Oscillospiraceae bacterium]